MYALILALGIIAGVIGVFTIGLGIAVFQSSVGNSLIIAGTVAAIGGMILFGLAAAVRQLGRIVDAIGPRPVAAPRRQPAPESVEGAPAARRPAPPYPPRPENREARPEMRPAPPAPAPAMEGPEPPPPPIERPRPNIFGVARGTGEPPMMEEEDETVPLAPNRTPAPSGRAAPPPRPERMLEPRPEPKPEFRPEPKPEFRPEPRPEFRPEPMPERMSEPMPEPRPTPASEPRPASPADIMARLANLASTPARPTPPPRPEPPRPLPASERPPEPRPRPNMFDSLWPADPRATRPSQSETIARAPKAESRPEPKSDVRPEPKPDLRFEPPRERNEAPVSREPMMPPPAEQRPIAILKSGVIDGMAYTLYTDGSIEAELPQGTMRFGSIEELRAHLENTERQD
jgi:hypothetical protein